MDLESPFMAKNSDNLQQFQVPFWRESASELFESANALLRLLSQCAEYQSLVETPLVGFATYMVALIGLYSTHFPWMDVRESMSINPASSSGHSGLVSLFFQRDAAHTRKALDLLSINFKPRLRQANEWLQVLARLHRYYLSTKKVLRRNYRNYNPFSPEESYKGSKTLMPLRMGEEEYIILDSAFGEVADVDMADALPNAEAHASVLETNPSINPTLTAEGAARDRWSAVNSSPGIVTGLGSANGPSTFGSLASGPPLLQPFTPPPLPGAIHRPPQSPTSARPDVCSNTETTEAGSSSTPAHVNWTTAQIEAYLDSLETLFGAKDIVGFAEGRGWREMLLEGGRDWRSLL
jgi:hypothetical protein